MAEIIYVKLLRLKVKTDTNESKIPKIMNLNTHGQKYESQVLSTHL